jgi:murein DD-endopeptidase MepM/ murein hydrolase activator NlpD
LRGIFAEQYQLSFVPETEIRTRTVTRTGTTTNTDPVTGEVTVDTYEYEDEEEYEWHILNVSLVSRPFSQVISPRMNADQSAHFEVLMQSKGGRQYVDNPFDFNWLPYVTSYYGYRIHPISGDKDYHKGVDIGIAAGTEIHAGFDGIVVTASYDGGYGNYVVIENEDGVQAKYAHCQTLSVSAGQTVAQGDVIATVGSTGNSTGAHLHLEVVKGGQYLNPIYFAVTGDDGSDRIPPGSPGGVIIPDYSGEPVGDGTFAAMRAEAERWIGMAYVWGGSSPSTGFDCSGYVSWIINQSGAGSVGRQTAQGLYNLCTPVSLADAEPGDLIFLQRTYSAPNPVTHVALYLGGGIVIHAGDPIGYANVNSSFWQQHFYAAGRLP